MLDQVEKVREKAGLPLSEIDSSKHKVFKAKIYQNTFQTKGVIQSRGEFNGSRNQALEDGLQQVFSILRHNLNTKGLLQQENLLNLNSLWFAPKWGINFN